MLQKIKETVNYITAKISSKPKVGIILGSGLGGLVEDIVVETAIPYKEIPNFPVSTVQGHKGQLLFGKVNGNNVVAMQGRFHYYEGYTMEQITFPVRVMKMLGVETLIVSNASGGVNTEFDVGDIMFITDHINLMPNPLIGKNIDELGPRFPDMSEAYSKALLAKAKKIARHLNIKYRTGVYAAMTGPSYETPHEYFYINRIGGDAVGMSTVPEVIVARHMNMEVFAVSVISDLGVEGKIVEVSHEDVMEAAEKAAGRIKQVVMELIREI
jgi:purine-nucleoside phosphorylase